MKVITDGDGREIRECEVGDNCPHCASVLKAHLHVSDILDCPKCGSVHPREGQ